MRIEREPRKEPIRRGDLYFLAHPGSDLFSGYGLALRDGRSDLLAGLLMVDRPYPADPDWLAQIEATYGECQLAPMTQSGERGLLAQMRVDAHSRRLLQPVSHTLGREIARALQPLLVAPPAPTFSLRWNRERQLWQSEFWMGLPLVLQDLFEKMGYGCLAVEQGDQAIFLTCVATQDVESFRTAQVLWRWELHTLPTAPLIRFRATILDDPKSPYLLEHFLNVGDAHQARLLGRLVKQPQLTFDFFDQTYQYAYSKQMDHSPDIRRHLQIIVERAIDYYGDIPAGQRNFDRAKTQFQHSHSV